MASHHGQSVNEATPYADNGLYPVQHSDKIVGGPALQQYGAQYGSQHGGYTQLNVEMAGTQKKRVCGVNRGVFVLFCIIGCMVALLVMIAGVFGAMIANQDTKIQNLQSSATKTDSAPAATTTWVEISDWQYVGCYRDNSQRIFRGANQNYTSSQTNRQCKNFCEKDFEYFGTETGGECYCSSTAPSQDAIAPPWSCNTACRGSTEGEMCGGSWFLSVWKKRAT